MSRRIARAFAVVTALSLASAAYGCAKRDAPDGGALPASPPAQSPDPSASGTTPGLEQARASQRQVIKNAELGLTVQSPDAAKRQAEKIAQRHGGYLVSSRADGTGDDPDRGPARIDVVLRVSAKELEPALDALRGLGTHVGSERIESRDVTEESVDLAARIKTQKKLEERYLAILGSAAKVDEMLSVERQLSAVRSEIEKLEGRKRLLDDQVALSTITISFVEERPLVAASTRTFGRAAKLAWADVQNVSAGIVVGFIRLTGVLVPMTLLVLLPLFLIGRFVVRRFSPSAGPRPLAG